MSGLASHGGVRFSDATNPAQGLLFTPKPAYDALRLAILAAFSGKQVSVGEVEDFVLAETPYRETHYKKQVLAPPERDAKSSPSAHRRVAGRGRTPNPSCDSSSWHDRARERPGMVHFRARGFESAPRR